MLELRCAGAAARPAQVRVRELPASGRPVSLLWLKRLCRCAEPQCSTATWSEASEHIAPRASVTERARREACRLVGQDEQAVASVAATLGSAGAP